jgi:hypothetical protein
MNKAPSKTDALRAMREARFKAPVPREAKKPPKTELQREVEAIINPPVPEPDVAPMKPAPNIATKRKKRTAEVIGKVREGKMQISAWIDADLYQELKAVVAESGMKQERWIENAIAQKLGRA